MIKFKQYSLVLFSILFSCNTNKEEQSIKQIDVDLLVHNAVVYTVDSLQKKAFGFTILNGKFDSILTTKPVLKSFNAKKIIDAHGKAITPGLYDAHAHFYGLGVQQKRVDLVGTKSFEEVLQRIQKFQNKNQLSYITGRGWDQNDWKLKEYPNKKLLDTLFPNTPVAIRRIDGHALLANSVAIQLAGVTKKTNYSGGEILKDTLGNLTGVFIDNPMELIESKIPELPKKDKIKALLVADSICHHLGLTTVVDAGLDKDVINLIDSLQQQKKIKTRIYAMVASTSKYLDEFLARGIYKTDKLEVRSVKFYADGSLGSRGACLHDSYSDKKNHYGALLSSLSEIDSVVYKIAKSDFQMNTHAIGDSANTVVLKSYKKYLGTDLKNRRWRIEHAQVVRPEDYHYFKSGVIPSVQPTHATSDMYWAEERLGPKRIKSAYAYQKLFKNNYHMCLGTDFPIEKVNPILTFYAATTRKDSKGYPKGGFQLENSLTRDQALYGMTSAAAYASFQENELGKIKKGYKADFVIFATDLMKVKEKDLLKVKAEKIVINGKE